MTKLGKHYIWLSKRCDATMRMVFEENGKQFIQFEHRKLEVRFDNKDNMYIAEA